MDSHYKDVKANLLTDEELSLILSGVTCAGIDAKDDSYGARLKRHIEASQFMIEKMASNIRILGAKRDGTWCVCDPIPLDTNPMHINLGHSIACDAGWKLLHSFPDNRYSNLVRNY